MASFVPVSFSPEESTAYYGAASDCLFRMIRWETSLDFIKSLAQEMLGRTQEGNFRTVPHFFWLQIAHGVDKIEPSEEWVPKFIQVFKKAGEFLVEQEKIGSRDAANLHEIIRSELKPPASKSPRERIIADATGNCVLYEEAKRERARIRQSLDRFAALTPSQLKELKKRVENCSKTYQAILSQSKRMVEELTKLARIPTLQAHIGVMFEQVKESCLTIESSKKEVDSLPAELDRCKIRRSILPETREEVEAVEEVAPPEKDVEAEVGGFLDRYKGWKAKVADYEYSRRVALWLKPTIEDAYASYARGRSEKGLEALPEQIVTDAHRFPRWLDPLVFHEKGEVREGALGDGTPCKSYTVLLEVTEPVKGVCTVRQCRLELGAVEQEGRKVWVHRALITGGPATVCHSPFALYEGQEIAGSFILGGDAENPVLLAPFEGRWIQVKIV